MFFSLSNSTNIPEKAFEIGEMHRNVRYEELKIQQQRISECLEIFKHTYVEEKGLKLNSIYPQLSMNTQNVYEKTILKFYIRRRKIKKFLFSFQFDFRWQACTLYDSIVYYGLRKKRRRNERLSSREEASSSCSSSSS